MRDPDLPIYVLDTHTLFWYLEYPNRLSPAADAVFRLAVAGGAHIVVPAIVVAELFYLTQRLGNAITPSTLLAEINRSREFVFSELGQAQLESMEFIDDVSEMHDRLIAAEALTQDAAIVSKDESLHRSRAVEVIW